MTLAPVYRLLRERTGLTAEALGASAVRALASERMARAGVGPDRYAERLAADAAEWRAFLDAVVVPETWFNRGGALFEHLAERARQVAGARAEPFRALSLPCSTGEEPYSLAIACAEVGLTPERVHIDGIDISARAIDGALRGVYSELSFRQADDAFRKRWFRPDLDGLRLREEVRAYTTFRAGNVLASGLLGRGYDLILCRNLFIYFAPEARRTALDALLAALAPSGWLGLGHADAVAPDEVRLERIGTDGDFLFRRPPRLVRPAHPAPGPALPAPPPAVTDDLLARARREADEGRLDAAAVLCRAARARFGPSADLHAVLGLVHQARRETDEAVEEFRKAVYYDPSHREALLHLVVLHQQRGDARQAELVRGRLARLEDA